MSADLPAPDPDSAYDRLAAIAGADLFEPRSLYEVQQSHGSLMHFAADPSCQLPAGKAHAQGADNYLFTGLDALTDRLGEISVRGHGNVVFLGADCRFPSLRVTILGNGNLVYIGAFANGGELHVDVADDGRMVRIGEDAMLARTRLAIGLGRKIEIIDADGQRLSPVSGYALTESADIIIDERVWVGREALITEGVRIGTSAIVGARSLVIGDVAKATINTGSPARRLRQGVTFSRSKASSLAADQALSRHGHRDRRLSLLKERIAEAIAKQSEVSLAEQLTASASPGAALDSVEQQNAPAPPVAAPSLAPFRPSSDEIAKAHRSLLTLAGDLPVDVSAEATVVACTARRMSAREHVVAFAHVSADGGKLGGIRCRGSGNYLFSAAGCDLARLHIDIADVSNTLIYIGPDVAVVEPSVIRVVGVSGGFVYVGRGCHLGGVTATLSGPGARLVIGEDCLFDGSVTIATADGYAMFDYASGEAINPSCSVTIGDRVYVGLDSVIDKGAVIGAGCVVAPRSVVTGELAAGGFYSGFPAQAQHRDIRWARTTNAVSGSNVP